MSTGWANDVGVDGLVAEILHEFARLERCLAEAEKRNETFKRRLRDVEKSRDRWREEVRNLKFQLAHRPRTIHK